MAVNPSDVGRPRRTPPPGVSPASLQPAEVRTDGVTSTARTDAAAPTSADAPVKTNIVTHRDLRGRRQQFEARKVRRLVRHIEPWSVLKLSLLLFLSMWLVFMIAAVIVWSVANGSGTIDKIETFVESNLGQSDFKFDGDFLFRQFGLIGLILTLAATLAVTIGAVVFNLISDIIGGVWITVIEEETTRPGTRPR